MVHALNEIERVLMPGAYLIDLRPFIEKPPVEVVVGDEIIAAGFIDSSADHPDDFAANDAIEHMVAAGLFVREKSDSFELYTYWNNVDEFKTYMNEFSTAILPPDTLHQVEQIVSQFDTAPRIRRRLTMIISRYRKP